MFYDMGDSKKVEKRGNGTTIYSTGDNNNESMIYSLIINKDEQ